MPHAVQDRSWEDRERLMTLQPNASFTTNPYRGHPHVLVNLATLDRTAPDRLLCKGWWETATPTPHQQHPDLSP